jgi:hypothetical protein
MRIEDVGCEIWDVKGGIEHRAWRRNCGFRIANCGLKSSMLDAGYSMLDKDILFTTET